MKLKFVFYSTVALAALAALAQPDAGPPGFAPTAPPGGAGTPIAPRVRNAPIGTPAPPSGPAAPAAPAATAPPAASGVAAVPVPNPPGPAPAAQPEAADLIYNWTMPVDQVLDIYAKLIGRTPLEALAGNLAIAGNSLVKLKVNPDHPLTRTEAIQALETVLGMNGITIVPIGDKFFKVVTEATAPNVGALWVTNSAKELPDSGRFITEIVQLKYADPDQVVKALSLFAKSANSIIYIPSTQSLILRDYTENVKRMMEMVAKIDVTSPLIIKPRVIPIKYALAADISAALGQLGAGSGGSFGRNNSGANFKSPTTSASTTQGAGFGTAMGGVPGQARAAGPSTGAAGAASNFGARLGGIVNGATGGQGVGSLFGGQTKIIADERTNSLLVFANDEDMKMILDIIAKLDVVLAQVLIEAIILEVNLTDTRNTGVSLLIPQQNIHNVSGAGGVNNLSSGASGFLSGTSTSTNASGTPSIASAFSTLPSLPGGFSYFAKWGNDLDAVLEAVAGDSRISVLSRPRIQTSHAVEAELFIGNTVPYVTGTQNYGYSTGPSSTYTEKEVGIRIKVLPLINPEGLVVMDIDQEIEQLGPSVAIPGAGNVPTTTKRDVGAKVAVKSGETIILGGFISATRSKSYAGVPWLMDVPGLGQLFKSTAIDNTRTELIVLMRPTVLKTPEIASKVATDEKHQMAAVEQAELDIREDERKRNEAASAALAKEAAAKAKKDAKAGTNTMLNPGAGMPSELEQP